VFGTAYTHFGGNEKGRQACMALGALADVGQVDATITNFLVPLQALVDERGRIHCSLNLNTETGRLSSRRPNLQNQPALEKDPYKIRDAFVASPGNTLIVADYGQLELRVLAHVTNCKSMLDAFEKGGCFHSRTAMGMYDYIREEVDRGEVLLEWDSAKGEKPPVPLVKDKFGSERRKAKTLNFSIAYGKTVHGLAEDWGITKEEAQSTLEAWYRDRPEVQAWQEKTKKHAADHGKVFTIMGRHRNLPDARDYKAEEDARLREEVMILRRTIRDLEAAGKVEEAAAQKLTLQVAEENVRRMSERRRMRDHALRAAINTPIQVPLPSCLNCAAKDSPGRGAPRTS
jgi:DNA polymerase-1